MNTSIKNKTAMSIVMALGFVLATLVVVALSVGPAGAVATPGKASAWGDNDYGQLGNGRSGAARNIPKAVSNIGGVKSVKAGCHHSIALKIDGTVRAWGYNTFGQLGDGTNTRRTVPVKVKIKNVKAIAAGCDHNLALKKDGTVWAWGYGYYGQLGNGRFRASSNVPVKVDNLGTGTRAIAAGKNFSLALMGDNRVRSWGYNAEGELGNGTSGPDTNRARPVPVRNLANVRMISTDSYADHSLALLANGTVRAWGGNYYGALGDGTAANFRTKPVLVSNLSGVKAIAAGGFHSLALLEGGRVRSWGYNSAGQLGNDAHGSGANSSTPVAVKGLANVKSISGGAYNSMAILESGRTRSWGDNSRGQLGSGRTGPDSDVPVGIRNLTNVKNIDGGFEFALAATR
jgi:alpha-tubulin suppressor-like RCC1 family protein